MRAISVDYAVDDQSTGNQEKNTSDDCT